MIADLDLPPRWPGVLARYRDREISAPIALAQLLLAGGRADVGDRLATLPGCEELAALARTHAASIERLPALVAELGGADPSPEGTRALFDRLAVEHPEAGVAIYSLGDPALLDAATAELIAVIDRWTPVAGRDLLDFGCGIGRVAIALAPRARSVLGLDLSEAMVAEARRRGAGMDKLSFVVGNGRDLAPVADGGIDLMIAVDSFPFLFAGGGDLIDRHLDEAARVLRPGGDLHVFNWSYRGNVSADIADAHRQAAAHGFAVVRAGETPFAIWDGVGFHLRRAS